MLRSSGCVFGPEMEVVVGGVGSGRKPELATVASQPSGRVKAPAMVRVQGPNGQFVKLLSKLEADYYKRLKDAYIKDFGFTGFADLEALGRILLQETMAFRYGNYLAQNVGPDEVVLSPQQEAEYRRSLSDSLKQISGMKSDLGMSRVREERETGAAYLESLLKRARSFGVTREKQLLKALVLFNELMSNIDAFDRSNQVERVELGFETEKDIVAYIRSKFPEYKEIDEYFTKNEQRYWAEPKQS